MSDGLNFLEILRIVYATQKSNWLKTELGQFYALSAFTLLTTSHKGKTGPVQNVNFKPPQEVD